MPRYFFHIFNDEITLDDKGMELPDLETARDFAIESVRHLICDTVQKGRLNLDHRIEINDEYDARLMTVTFREAVTVIG